MRSLFFAFIVVIIGSSSTLLADSFADVTNRTGVKTMSAIAQQQGSGNIVYSPLSTSNVLGVLAVSSSDEARNEILEFMETSSSEFTALSTEVRTYLGNLPNSERDSIGVFNYYYSPLTSRPKESLLQGLRDQFYLKPEFLEDFSVENVVSSVNKQVKNDTGIEDLLTVQDFNGGTPEMIVLNTTKVSAQFKTAFREIKAEDEYGSLNFQTTTESKSVASIRGTTFGFHWEDPIYFGGIETQMSYVGIGQQVGLLILQPSVVSRESLNGVLSAAAGDSLNGVLSAAAGDSYDLILSNLSDIFKNDGEKLGRSSVQMPMFSVKTEQSLIDVLSSIGVTKIFDGLSDQSPLFPKLNVSDNTRIEILKQVSEVTLDKNGIKADAATAGGGSSRGASPPNDHFITIDSSFVFVLVHVASGGPVFTFMGLIDDPTLADN